MAKDLPERLAALGVDKLTALLMELADRDAAIKKKLVMLTATSTESLKKVRTQISGLKRTKRFHDWKATGKLREKMQLILQVLGQLQIEPRKGFELVCSFYETDSAVFGSCDDSSGMIGTIYKHDAHNLLVQFGRQCDEKEWLAEKALEVSQGTGYGSRDGILTSACEYLPEAEVRKLIDRCCKLAAEAEEGFVPTENDPWNWDSRRHWSAAAELAAGIQDAPLHEMAYTSEWGDKPTSSAGWNSIAKVYLSAGDPKTALKRLANIDAGETFQSYDTEQLRIAAHKAIGTKASMKQVASILRKRLFASPSGRTMAELSEFLEPSERQPIVDDLIFAFTEKPKLDFSFLDFALNELELSIAESYLLNRSDQIDGEQYYSLGSIAKLFAEKKSPLAATLIFRALADSILQRAIFKNYRIAVGYIKRCAKLAPGISDWQGQIDHDAYLETLHTNHKRKSAFWSKMT